MPIDAHTSLAFPLSLRKLVLSGTGLDWEELTTKIGSLPLLQVLKLQWQSCKGHRWETVDGQFCSLIFLQIETCDLEDWMTDSTRFPCLKRLFLQNLDALKEIPLSMGDIPTLQSIHLYMCCESAIESAQRIREKQKEFGKEDLKVQIADISSDEEEDDDDDDDDDEEDDDEEDARRIREEQEVFGDEDLKVQIGNYLWSDEEEDDDKVEDEEDEEKDYDNDDEEDAARRIREEQEVFGDDDLKVQIRNLWSDEEDDEEDDDDDEEKDDDEEEDDEDEDDEEKDDDDEDKWQ